MKSKTANGDVKMSKISVENKMIFAWTVSLLATSGSLFFSEVMKFIPCEMCWYQRILMYPQVILLGIMLWRKDGQSIIYVLPLSIIGVLVSVYHNVIQKIPQANVISCGIIPCDIEYINWFGFITIPMLSLIAFLALVWVQISILINHYRGKSI
ncbi:disulfide oxidoreductase [Oceanobacillus zhaokaii]|nr:disulfide oxidoreductase [Oceanobacillus zhaokaii]